MKTGEFPWEARAGETLDPRLVNENFRKAVDYIKDASSLRYTYSEVVFNLDGIDPSDADMRKRRFIFAMPPQLSSGSKGSTNIVGGELSCIGMVDGDNIWVRWLATDVLPNVISMNNDTGAGVPLDVITPSGGPSKSWRYLEVNGTDEFTLDESINQRYLRVGDTSPVGLNVLEIGTDSGFQNSNTSCSLKLWIRHDRGSPVDIPTPQLYSGDDPPDADIFNDAATSLGTEHDKAVAHSNTNQTWKVEVFVVKNLPATLVEIQAKMHARIPCPDSDLEDVPFSIWGIALGFVARTTGDGFVVNLLNPSREFGIRVDDASGSNVMPEIVTNLNGNDSGSGVPYNYDEIYRYSDADDPPYALGRAGADPADPADDNEVLVNDELPAGSQPIEMIYVYVFYMCNRAIT